MECSTIEEVRRVIREHLDETLESDVRVFVFMGRQLELVSSEDRRQSPILIAPSGKQYQVYDAPVKKVEFDSMRTGRLYDFGDEELETAESEDDFDAEDDFLM